MSDNKNNGLVINLGGLIVLLAIIVPLLKALETGIVADAVSLELMGLIMVIAMILCIIPGVNLYLLTIIGPYVSEQLTTWGTVESWHTAFIFGLGFIGMVLVTLLSWFVVAILAVGFIEALRGDKRAMSESRKSIGKTFRITRR